MSSTRYQKQINQITEGIQKLNTNIQSLKKAQELERLFQRNLNQLNRNQPMSINGVQSKKPKLTARVPMNIYNNSESKKREFKKRRVNPPITLYKGVLHNLEEIKARHKKERRRQ